MYLPELEEVSDSVTHPDGRLYARGSRWIGLWTQDDPGATEHLTRIRTATLPAGDYRLLVELWHQAPRGAPLATLAIEHPGGTVTSRLLAAPFDDLWLGGMQTTAVELMLPEAGPLTVDLYADGGRRFYLGAVVVAPASPRATYVIQHCANGMPRARRAVAGGANALEMDVQWSDGELLSGHPTPNPAPCWFSSARRRDLGRLLGQVAQWMRDGTVSVLVVDVKEPETDLPAYGAALADALSVAGIRGESVVLSVPVASAARFREAVENAGIAGVHLDAWHDIAEGEPQSDWIEASLDAGADFLGVGADPTAFWRPTPTWAEALKDLIDHRDRDGHPEHAYFWTLERPASMRFGLDLGVDGIIANHPRRLRRVLAKPPYDRLNAVARGGPLTTATTRHEPQR